MVGRPKPGPPWWLSYVTLALALVGMLWTAATQWQALQDRVKVLESKINYLHGMIVVPEGY